MILILIITYYSEAIAKRASNISRENLASLGLCFGKFTKTGKFTLHVTSLDYLAQYAKYKIWLKNTAEMSYMYGNHVLKAHINKMTEDTPEHQGVIIYSASDLPLVSDCDYFEICESHYIILFYYYCIQGFAVTSKSSAAIAKLDPTAIAAYHQTDIGEYLRDEDNLI